MGARGRAVGLEELRAIDRVLADEIAVVSGQDHGARIQGGGGIGGGIDVGDQGGAGGRAVGNPDLCAMRPVVRPKRDPRAEGCQIGHSGVGNPRIDVLDDMRAGGCAVGNPQLRPVHAVRVGEEQLVSDDHSVGKGDAAGGGEEEVGARGRAIRRIEARAARSARREQEFRAQGEQSGAADAEAALDERFAAGRAVRDEQAVADAALVSVEIELAVEEGVVAERRARGVAGDGDRSGGRAVRGPQLHALSAAIGGGEDQPGAERDEVGGA